MKTCRGAMRSARDESSCLPLTFQRVCLLLALSVNSKRGASRHMREHISPKRRSWSEKRPKMGLKLARQLRSSSRRSFLVWAGCPRGAGSSCRSRVPASGRRSTRSGGKFVHGSQSPAGKGKWSAHLPAGALFCAARPPGRRRPGCSGCPRAVSGAGFAIFQANQIVGAAPVELLLLCGRDHVIGRADHIGQILYCLDVIAQSPEWNDNCHCHFLTFEFLQIRTSYYILKSAAT